MKALPTNRFKTQVQSSRNNKWYRQVARRQINILVAIAWFLLPSCIRSWYGPYCYVRIYKTVLTLRDASHGSTEGSSAKQNILVARVLLRDATYGRCYVRSKSMLRAKQVDATCEASRCVMRDACEASRITHRLASHVASRITHHASRRSTESSSSCLCFFSNILHFCGCLFEPCDNESFTPVLGFVVGTGRPKVSNCWYWLAKRKTGK